MFDSTALGRLAKTDSKWYLFLGVLSLLKAYGVRRNPRRLRKELLDAALFLTLGLLMRVVEGRGSSRRTPTSKLKAWRDKSTGAGSRADRVRGATDAIRDRLSMEDPEAASRVAAVRRRLDRV